MSKNKNGWDLTNIPKIELEKELERRKEEIPTLVKHPDWYAIVNYIQDEGITRLENGEHLSDDFEHYLFENVMEIFYGKDIWRWWNKKEDNQ